MATSMSGSYGGGGGGNGSYPNVFGPDVPKNNLEAARKAFAKGLRPAKKKMTNLASAKNAINYPMHHVDSYGRKLPYGPYQTRYNGTGVATAGYNVYKPQQPGPSTMGRVMAGKLAGLSYNVKVDPGAITPGEVHRQQVMRDTLKQMYDYMQTNDPRKNPFIDPNSPFSGPFNR